VLCAAAIAVVNLRDEMASLLLVLLGAGALVVVRKLGYLEYFAADKLFGWLRDVSDVAGITRDRRSFLSLQIEITHAQTLEELWANVCRALEIMHFDRAELHLLEKKRGEPGEWIAGLFAAPPAEALQAGERRRTGARAGGDKPATAGAPGRARFVKVWARGHHRRGEDVSSEGMLRVEIPLGVGSVNLFNLVLIKNLSLEPVHPYTLRRVEHLRRSVVGAMGKLCTAPAPAYARARARKAPALHPVHGK
jgi:UDP-GlcNAc:undecaprenyl-phosphate GlcNAc-1-phosphate transferase